METVSASLASYAGNSPVTGEFPSQSTMTQSFDIFFDLRLNKRLSKQPWGWWYETLSLPLWRRRNVVDYRKRCINSVRLTCKMNNIEYANMGHKAEKPCHPRKSPLNCKSNPHKNGFQPLNYWVSRQWCRECANEIWNRNSKTNRRYAPETIRTQDKGNPVSHCKVN